MEIMNVYFARLVWFESGNFLQSLRVSHTHKKNLVFGIEQRNNGCVGELKHAPKFK
jgi:hypothetical protein